MLDDMPDDDLVAPEGVDEGSAAATTEAKSAPSHDVLGPPAGTQPHPDEAPLPLHVEPPQGPGQQLEEGEG